MARYVLLEFDKDEDAEAFSGLIIQDKDTPGVAMRVRGIFKKPTLFCECADKGDKSVRGEKWGWWLHRKCGKPKAGHWQHPHNLLFANPKERTVYVGTVEP